jgi:hypothetical protein
MRPTCAICFKVAPISIRMFPDGMWQMRPSWTACFVGVTRSIVHSWRPGLCRTSQASRPFSPHHEWVYVRGRRKTIATRLVNEKLGIFYMHIYLRVAKLLQFEIFCSEMKMQMSKRQRLGLFDQTIQRA